MGDRNLSRVSGRTGRGGNGAKSFKASSNLALESELALGSALDSKTSESTIFRALSRFFDAVSVMLMLAGVVGTEIAAIGTVLTRAR